MMKKIIALILVLTFVFALSGCKNDKGRIKYNLKLEKYVTLCEYEGLVIDKKGNDYKKAYESTITSDVESYDLHEKITEGKLKDGDVANIDYEGKINGVAFSGGTAKGYDLKLGSDTFIDGFEDKLVGVKIGSTVDLDLTFPKDYGSTELAGKDVVFTVKVNYVKTETALKPEAFYKDLGCETVEEYYETVEKRTINDLLLNKVLTDSKVNKYPEKEKESVTEQGIENFEINMQNYYGSSVTLESYLSANGQTREEFEDYVFENYTKSVMAEEMVIYAIFDDAGMKMDKDAIAKRIKEIVASYDSDTITEKTLKETYGEDYFEYLYTQEKVLEYLKENAKIS
ncbi:MAG: FKBP-type peptidyl-prolyl cis-trans isomerase [Clostridia bacterium]|nr:FKBP-type peptidyl-prolyl cis-trans isomerase [Clostridia bacterium]